MNVDLIRYVRNALPYFDNISQQHVCFPVHLFHFFKLISESKTECLELQVCILPT